MTDFNFMQSYILHLVSEINEDEVKKNIFSVLQQIKQLFNRCYIYGTQFIWTKGYQD